MKRLVGYTENYYWLKGESLYGCRYNYSTIAMQYNDEMFWWFLVLSVLEHTLVLV